MVSVWVSVVFLFFFLFFVVVWRCILFLVGLVMCGVLRGASRVCVFSWGFCYFLLVLSLEFDLYFVILSRYR